jgi:hypothetical protein
MPLTPTTSPTGPSDMFPYRIPLQHSQIMVGPTPLRPLPVRPIPVRPAMARSLLVRPRPAHSVVPAQTHLNMVRPIPVRPPAMVRSSSLTSSIPVSLTPLTHLNPTSPFVCPPPKLTRSTASNHYFNKSDNNVQPPLPYTIFSELWGLDWLSRSVFIDPDSDSDSEAGIEPGVDPGS